MNRKFKIDVEVTADSSNELDYFADLYYDENDVRNTFAYCETLEEVTEYTDYLLKLSSIYNNFVVNCVIAEKNLKEGFNIDIELDSFVTFIKTLATKFCFNLLLENKRLMFYESTEDTVTFIDVETAEKHIYSVEQIYK